MRLLVVSDLFPPVVRGGYEVECRDVCAHLRESHDVTVLTSDLDAGAQPPERGVHRVLPWVGGLTRTDALAAPWTARAAIARTREHLRDIRPDAVWLWNGSGIPAAAVRVLQESGVPLLVRVCEYWFTRFYGDDQFTKWLAPPPASPARAAWHRALVAANRLPGLGVRLDGRFDAAVSWNSGYVRDHAPAPPSFSVVFGDVTLPSTARMAEMEQVPRRPEPGRVLFVGRLDADKGAEVLLRAVARLQDPRLSVRVVGSGSESERDALTSSARELGLAGAVRLTGPLTGPALQAEIAAAAAWCVPSVWPEPAGLTCVEAALARVPAVLSHVGGIPEVLRPDEHALFFAAGDDAGCAQALRTALDGGPEVEARVERAHHRGTELSFAPYLERMDAFLADGLAALRAAAAKTA